MNHKPRGSNNCPPTASDASAVHIHGPFPAEESFLTALLCRYREFSGRFELYAGSPRFDRTWPTLRVLILCVLVLSLTGFVASTLHWPLVNDAAQIDYACFLMDHGMAPYRDLVELNMPGTYLANWSVMHTLGAGALAWRVFDFLLLAVAGVAMMWIARPYGLLGGFFGAALFALFHGRDGPAQAGQRDLIIAVLLLLAYAFLFQAVRQAKTWPLILFGVSVGFATTIKPPVTPLGIALLAAMAFRLRRDGRPLGPALCLSLGGVFGAWAVVTGFLLVRGSLGSFLWYIGEVLPYYATIGRQSSHDLILSIMSPTVKTLGALSMVIALLRRLWNWEATLLLAAIALGAASYFAQGKGFPYHRYPMLAFVFLWAGIQFVSGLKHGGLVRMMALTGLLLGAIFAPIYTRVAARSRWDEDFNRSLTADLTRLGGQRLSNHIQCLTTPGDCDTVLYRMHLVQASGLFYDYLIFGPSNQPVIEHTREAVWQAFTANPPEVFVVGRGLFGEMPDNYQKLSRWPQLAQLLRTQYALYDERGFRPAECGYRGYRIYVRKTVLNQLWHRQGPLSADIVPLIREHHKKGAVTLTAIAAAPNRLLLLAAANGLRFR